MLDTLQTLPGDLLGDGEVGLDDLLVLSQNFGKDSPSYTDGNIDLKDGVNFADFLLLSHNFGKTLPAVAAEFATTDASSIDAVFGEL